MAIWAILRHKKIVGLNILWRNLRAVLLVHAVPNGHNCPSSHQFWRVFLLFSFIFRPNIKWMCNAMFCEQEVDLQLRLCVSCKALYRKFWRIYSIFILISYLIMKIFRIILKIMKKMFGGYFTNAYLCQVLSSLWKQKQRFTSGVRILQTRSHNKGKSRQTPTPPSSEWR